MSHRLRYTTQDTSEQTAKLLSTRNTEKVRRRLRSEYLRTDPMEESEHTTMFNSSQVQYTEGRSTKQGSTQQSTMDYNNRFMPTLLAPHAQIEQQSAKHKIKLIGWNGGA